MHYLSKNVAHRERVEARIMEDAPDEELLEKAAQIQQVLLRRGGR
jgi:uncharacterized protein (DUF1778 family)